MLNHDFSSLAFRLSVAEWSRARVKWLVGIRISWPISRIFNYETREIILLGLTLTSKWCALYSARYSELKVLLGV